MAQIRVEALDKSFDAFRAVKAASFIVEDGQFLCLLGPSGCGKTTTLRMIAGLELPTAGTIRLGGEDVTMKRASARDIAFVFQLFALYPHMNEQHEPGAMADMIAVKNKGVVEQGASPRYIYARPASFFVAVFIGPPPMNFLPFRGSLETGAEAIRLGEREVAIPAAREALAESDLVLGVRPEHVRFTDRGMVRGEVYGSEYLGTTQIVTVTTRYGALKARSPASMSFRTGENVGLDFRPDTLSIFDRESGRAIRTALYEGGAHG